MSGIPRPEHPRPDLQRAAWRNLNGTWRFSLDPKREGEEKGWYRTLLPRRSVITVPYPWESRLSGINRPDYTGIAWYQREIRIPESWSGMRVFLVFGAVDCAARVWLNEELLGAHEGGYTPFEMEITRNLAPGQSGRLTVQAIDETDPETPTGKQIRWYTHTSGIWQTVYMEARGEVYVENLWTQCEVKESAVTFHLSLSSGTPQAVQVRIDSEDGSFPGVAREVELSAGRNTLVEKIVLEEPNLWSPDHPDLYLVRISVVPFQGMGDSVSSYFGFRQIAIAPSGPGEVPRILLNGKPVYLRGALHQSFHPDGIYTYPSDETIRKDFLDARRFGLNCLRVHIKVEEPRFYYWADRLGILILYDLPNFWEHSSRARSLWEAMVREAIRRDRGHPSILFWVNFNESWGIGDGRGPRENYGWVDEMAGFVKSLDPTRPVEDNSPCRYDHVTTDINSWHFYIDDPARARRHIAEACRQVYPGSAWNFFEGYAQESQPFLNSEYGAVSAGGGDRDVAWGMKYLTNELRLHEKICGYVYTELTDIEWEHNGLLDYDRSEKGFGYEAFSPGLGVSCVHAADFLAIDFPPYGRYPAGSDLQIPVLMASFSDRAGESLTFHWELSGIDRFGLSRILQTGRKSIVCPSYAVAPVEKSAVRVPEERMLCTFRCWVESAEGAVLAANYVHLDTDAETPAMERVDERTLALRFPPDAPRRTPWLSTVPGKAYGTGVGYQEYALRAPGSLDTSSLDRIELLIEVAAKAGIEKLDWPSRRRSQDYPQTSSRIHRSEVIIYLNGFECGRFLLPDDPADARGVLSHATAVHHGSFGYLLRSRVELADRADLRESLREGLTLRFEVPSDAADPGGLTLFGKTTGRYPFDPTVLLVSTRPIPGTVSTDAETSIIVPPVDGFPQPALPSGQSGGSLWKYSEADPGEGWIALGFEDSGWKTGTGGFGTAETPGACVGTRWESADIWLRGKVNLADASVKTRLYLELHHDEDVEIYVNGEALLSLRGYRTDYEIMELAEEKRSLFHAGENLICVHCRQTRGGQFVDVGVWAISREGSDP